MSVKIVEVSVPEYTVTREPDYLSIGLKVDRVIEGNFPDGTYVLRAIGVDDHPGQTVDRLMRTILTIGTDKYDSDREDVGQEEFSGYDYDIHAGPIRIRASEMVIDSSERFITVFGGIAWHFYNGAPLDRGHPFRIDLLMLYDSRKVVRARKTHPGARSVRRGLAQHLYRFKDRKNKLDALRGLVKVSR